MTLLILTILIHRFRKWKARRRLHRQEELSKRGVGFRTKVLEVKEEGHPLKNYVQLCILTRLRVNGRIVYKKVHTLLKEGAVLRPGDKVHIRYNPFHLNAVLLGGFSNN